MTADAMTRAVYDRHGGSTGYGTGPKAKDHPLGCLTVAEWVSEARSGWPRCPKAPTPKQAAERALRIAGKYEGVNVDGV